MSQRSRGLKLWDDSTYGEAGELQEGAEKKVSKEDKSHGNKNFNSQASPSRRDLSKRNAPDHGGETSLSIG